MMRPPSGATAFGRPHLNQETKSCAQRPNLRPAISAFVNASETLLSPSLRPPDFTQEEREAVAQYVIALSGAAAPWCECLLDGLREKIAAFYDKRKGTSVRRMH